MTVVSDFRRVSTVDLSSPRSSLLRSDGKQTILFNFSEKSIFLAASVDNTRSRAPSGEAALTRQYTVLTCSLAINWAITCAPRDPVAPVKICMLALEIILGHCKTKTYNYFPVCDVWSRNVAIEC